MFWTNLGLIALVAGITVLWTCILTYNWPDSVAAKYPDRILHNERIDEARSEMRRVGLVLHMPSYQNGVEAYCLENEQYSKLPKSWLGRI